jgi:type I restriction enzyme, S subunit
MSDTPKIRFNGYTDVWEQRKVSEMFKVTRGYVLPATDTSEEISDEMPYPVYSSQTKDNGLMGYYSDYLYEDAITWTTDGANAGTVNFREGKFYCTNVCGVLLSDKIEASKAIAEALNNVAKKYVSYVGNPKLMNNVMADIQITIPTSREERNKISSYFSNLDHAITLHQRKSDEMKELKKYMLQKMFPKPNCDKPEIRFAGFTDAWEQRKLGEILEEFSEKSVVEDEYPVLSSTNKCMEFRDGRVSGSSNLGYKIIDNGDLVLSPQNLWLGNININDIGKGLVSPSYKTFKVTGVDGNFLNPQLRKPAMLNAYKEASTQGASVVRRNLDLDLFNGITIKAPSLEEQSKIGNYFASLDHAITLHQRKSDEFRELKKYMLQNMFPKQ